MENTPKHFFCKKDKYYFFVEDYTLQDDIAFAICDICGEEIHEVPHYYGNIAKAQGKQTGPKTEKGKKRSSMNGFKHGMRSRQLHLLAPAITDRYPECTGCEHKEPCKDDSDFKYCPVIVKPMMTFIKAYEDGDVDELKSFAGFTHARVFQILQIVLKEIFEKGTLQPKTISTRFKTAAIDGDGNTEEEIKETVLEWQRNPLLSQIPKLMETIGMTADQQAMTPDKEQGQSNTEGFIEIEKDKMQTDREFEERRNKQMEEVKEAQIKAIENRKKDDLLNEFNQEEIKEKNGD
jgi:hypothetical protein